MFSRFTFFARPRKLVRTALIAAVYVALCLVFAPLSFGPVQIRISEALTLLPVFCPEAIVGVTLGCFLANMLASAPIDMVVGTTATLLAALCTYRLRNLRWQGPGKRWNPGLPLAASLPPVLFNAVIVGIELTVLYFPAGSPVGVYALNMVSVGAGQVVSCCVLGLALAAFIERRPVLLRMFQDKAARQQR